MLTRLLRLTGTAVLLAAAVAASAQEVSEDFIKTYRAYDQAFRQGDIKRAAELAQKTLVLAVEELGPEHEKIPVLLINLGHADLLLGELDEAEKYLNEAKNLIKDKHPDARGNLITIHEDLAQVHIGRQELKQARQELDQSIELRSGENGAGDPAIADLLGLKARLDIAEQKYDSAERLLQRGRRIIEDKYGPDNNRTAAFITSLGDLAVIRDRLQDAEQLYLQAMAILKKNLLADDRSVLALHQKLAKLYIAMDSDKFASHADTYIAGAELKEGEALPYFIIKPDKPAGGDVQSGWVLLEMTISKDGRVQNPRVIESSPAGVLDSVVMNAARKWRFKPKIKDGERLSQPNTRARIVFKGDKVEVHLGEMG
jgi:TonB family protein